MSFDDAFRQGVWAGVYYQPAPRFRIGLDGRTNSGGSAGNSDSYGMTFGANGFTRRNLGFNSRVTQYANDRVDGWLYAADFGFGLSSGIYVRLGGGRRDEDSVAGIADTLNWYGVDIDFTLGRHWYLLIAAERTAGDFEEDEQIFTTLSYQF